MTQGVEMLVAFAAGALSFLSPCVLPLVPGYISFVSGVSLDEMGGLVNRGRTLAKASLASLCFGAGFTMIFVILGATATLMGKFVYAWLPLVQGIAGVVIVVFGLHTLRLVHLRFLCRELRFVLPARRASLPGAFVLGMAFALGWTPCIGPILAGILVYASSQETESRGLLLLGTYSLGLGLPFLAMAVALNASRAILDRIKRHTRTVELVSGTLLIVLGITVSTGNLSQMASYVTGLFGDVRYP